MSIDVRRSPVALELKAYFDGRVRCVKADPPCAIRPCAKHHAEAYLDLGATTCPACDGADLVALGDEPCPICDGYGRVWVFSVSALASTSSTGVAARLRTEGDVDGTAGRVPAVSPATEGQASGSTSVDSNRPVREHRAAESGPVRPQTGR